MIMGVDHIALSCLEIETACKNLEKDNFKVRFCEKNIPNKIEKKEFLNHYQKTHSLAFIEAQKGPAIELTEHGSSFASGESIYRVQQGKGTIETVEVLACDFEASRSFWRDKLRFEEKVLRADEAVKLKLTSPFPQWNLEVDLIQSSGEKRKNYLDVEGFSCIAFISNKIESDLENIWQAGKRASEVFELEVNRKWLKVAMVEGPSGEIIELIEIQKR